jgi:hypothetical protein
MMETRAFRWEESHLCVNVSTAKSLFFFSPFLMCEMSAPRVHSTICNSSNHWAAALLFGITIAFSCLIVSLLVYLMFSLEHSLAFERDTTRALADRLHIFQARRGMTVVPNRASRARYLISPFTLETYELVHSCKCFRR